MKTDYVSNSEILDKVYKIYEFMIFICNLRILCLFKKLRGMFALVGHAKEFFHFYQRQW